MKPKDEWNSDIKNGDETGNGSDDETLNSGSEELSDAIIEVNDPLSKLEADLTSANDKYLRLYSEFENYKRRVSKDRIEQSKMAAADIFLSFLPIIDDLERALKSLEDAKDNKSVKEGVKLIYSKIKNITDSKGLKEMEAVGMPFDPELHDAIANVPASADDQKGKVIEETEKGYFLNDRVLRHAKVIVGN